MRNGAEMPQIIPLQQEVVYGPIRSRRLGFSLGINVLPVSHKVCSSNCVYCQYGWTPSDSFTERLKRAEELLAEIDESFGRIAALGTPVDCITLAGNGEPTLHPELEKIILGLKSLRDRDFPRASVGILSDSTQIIRPKVAHALALLDVRCMKLDAGDEETWRRINAPLGSADFWEMVQALTDLPDIILQSLFLQGSYDNTQEAHVKNWIRVVGRIHPRSVHVYTVDRGTAAPGITEVPRQRLQEIAEQLSAATGIPAEVFE